MFPLYTTVMEFQPFFHLTFILKSYDFYNFIEYITIYLTKIFENPRIRGCLVSTIDSLRKHYDLLIALSVTSNSRAKHTEKLPVAGFQVDTMSAKAITESGRRVNGGYVMHPMILNKVFSKTPIRSTSL